MFNYFAIALLNLKVLILGREPVCKSSVEKMTLMNTITNK